MNVKHILLPIDFSDFSSAANDYASLIAQSSGAKITYLHISLPDVAYGTPMYVDVASQEAQDQARLEEFKPTVEGIEVQYIVEFGSPIDRIVEYADENDVDLIVMGTHGRTGLHRVIMGSVAEAVVRKSRCPVLALKSDVTAVHHSD